MKWLSYESHFLFYKSPTFTFFAGCDIIPNKCLFANPAIYGNMQIAFFLYVVVYLPAWTEIITKMN